MSQSIDEAWLSYLSSFEAGDVSARDDLLSKIDSDEPAEVWASIRAKFAKSFHAKVLGYLATEVIDALRVRGGVRLWESILSDANLFESLNTAVVALNRYNEKYAALMNELSGQPGKVIPAESRLLLPNPHDESETHEHSSRLEQVGSDVKLGFLGRDQESWDRVQSLIDRSPHSAWLLGMDLLDEAEPDDVSWVGIGILESLITYHEHELRDWTLEELPRNARLQEALSSCYLNPSEQFIDDMLQVLRTASSRAV